MTGAMLIAPAPPRPAETEPVAASKESSTPDSRRTYSCPECEHVLNVSGLGRHRVYFELGGQRSHEPIMDRVCPVCGHGLPGKSPR
jgi:hypothetical protein